MSEIIVRDRRPIPKEFRCFKKISEKNYCTLREGHSGNCRNTEIKKAVSAQFFRPASPRESVVILPQTEVKCQLQMDDKTMKAWILVSVKSLVRPGLWGSVAVDADTPNLEYLVSQAAEAVATKQCLNYGDQHNPGDVAKTARECLRDIKQAADAARKHRGSGR